MYQIIELIGSRKRLYHKIGLIMRLTTVIMFACLMQVSAAGLAQKITLNQRNVSLATVLKEIRKQSGFDVYSDGKGFPKNQKVTVVVTNASIEEALDQAFKGLEYTYKIDAKTIAIKPKDEANFFERIIDRFEGIDVTGKIVDEKGEPIAGATIKVKGNNLTTNSGIDGSFVLKNVAKDATIEITYIGFQNKEVKARKQLGTITLDISVGKLEEVTINAGYYTVKDSERTGSIARITAKDIEKQPVTNVLATMQGRMAGVNVVQSTGVPGGAFNIEIRGRNSIRTEGNAPLYIIDGMPFPTQRLENITGSLFLNGPNPIDGIHPADIESIEVLKDADATSIYGSRGANGVVLISTKKGKAGKTAYNLNAYSGIGRVIPRLKLMNTQEYLEMRKEAFANDGLSTSSLEYKNAYDLNGTWDLNRYTDWQKELIGGTSAQNNIQLGVSGGNRETQFLISGTHSNETTVFPGNFGYKKSAALLNLNHSSYDGKFNVSFSGNYVVSKNDQPIADLTYEALRLAPNAPALYKNDGSLNWQPGFDNPLAPLMQTYLAKNNTLTTGGIIGFKPFPGFEIKSAFGFTDVRLDESRTSPYTRFNPAFGLNSSVSSYVLNNGYKQSWNIEPQASWIKQIGAGELNILLGTTFQQSYSKMVNHNASNFTSNSLIQNIGAAKTIRVSENDIDYHYNALFFRVNYNLQEKYILNITARRDGSSRFGPGKRFGNFGAAGFAWLFGKEKFVNELIPFLSFGKLRSSYGTSGSDQIGDYQFLDTYTSGSSNYQGVIGLAPSRLFNPDFSWETNKKLEFAMDLGFLKDRIFFTAAYFRNRSSNQLVGLPLPGMTGFTSMQANLNATVQNTGLEFELKTTNIQSGTLHWTSTLNFTIPRNKLVSFPDFESSEYAYDYILGHSLNTRKLYKYTGVNPQTGLYTFKDYNNDGKISFSDDRNMFVDMTSSGFGGIGNHISYRNFELDFVLQFEKRKGINPDLAWSNIAGNIGSQPASKLQRWQKSGDVTNVQRYTAGYAGTALEAGLRLSSSDGALTDASFIRMKTFSLAYNLKNSWLKASNFRIFLQAQNLFTITNYTGLDPETQGNYSLPPLRIITAGIKLNY